MSLEQRVENIVGRLDVIMPQLSEYRAKTDAVVIDVATLSQKVTSELEAIGRELRDIKQTLKSLVGSPQERRSHLWDLLLLAISNIVGVYVGWRFHS